MGRQVHYPTSQLAIMGGALHMLLLRLVILVAGLMSISSCTACIETERRALLEFKKHMKDPHNILSSWEGQDCCSWQGVRCDNRTGNIVRLEAKGRMISNWYWQFGQLTGKISPSLLHLQHLKHLDLSYNSFDGARIPSFIGQFKDLRYLNLSLAGFQGPIPASFGNLSSLRTLDLSGNYEVHVDDPDHQWLSHLTSLQLLYMRDVNLTDTSRSLFLALNKLPSINEIHLSGCGLEKLPPSIPHLNFSSLSFLDLSGNYINFSVSSWVFNIKSLQYLDLHFNVLPSVMSSPGPARAPIDTLLNEISIPEGFGNLCSLQTLHLSSLKINKSLVELGGVFSGCLMDSLTDLQLSSTNLKGDIPDWIGDIKNLKFLDLSFNSLSGSVPSSLARLSSLETLWLSHNELNGTLSEEIGKHAQMVDLRLSFNRLSGVISEAHFTQLEKLERLYFSGNSLVFNVSSNWVPPFLLRELTISNCSVGPEFPTWLQTQHKLDMLDMSQNGISSTMPDWLWNLTTRNLVQLDLSHNQIQGMIPKFSTSVRIEYLDLSSNLFSGSLPDLHIYGSPMFWAIDFSNNSFSGPIPRIMPHSDTSYSEVFISISMNKLNGSVPDWLCQMKGLEGIDISKNHLSGELPDCWLHSSTLSHMDFAHNNISGAIPDSVGHLVNLQSLVLSHNKLSGEFPVSLKNCSYLLTLDLGHNNFTGSIPTWIGERLSSLMFLMLEWNAFVNHIPQEICQLKDLQILDLSSNNLSGPIPKTLSNLTSMRFLPEISDTWPDVLDGEETVLLSLRARQDEYGLHALLYNKFIDVSNNELSGNIPEELASLYGLQSLNLSGNILEGQIPDKLGRMQQLLSLDLSRNKLSGSIPATLSNLTFLSLFNVSHNNLSGRIPSGNQFNTFSDPSIYVGNHLCGFPVSDNCTEDDGRIIKEEASEYREDEDDDEMLWVCMGLLSGFAVGFWTVWGVLAFKKKWRHAYFRCMDNTYDNIYVYVVVSFARMRTKMTRIISNHY